MEHIRKVVYINLDRRTDRRQEIEEELLRMGISGAERFPAIEADPGYVGCLESHLAVLKKARDEKWKNVLILEDDFQFIVSKEILEKSLNDFFELNIPYDVLMLSYNVQISRHYNTIISKCEEVQTASGYIVHERMYTPLIDLYEEALPALIRTQHHWIYMNDQIWKRLQPNSDWYIFNERIGIQRPSYSDLSNRYVNHGV